MRRIAVVVALCICAGLPAFAASRVTVAQLNAVMEEMHSQGKNDETTANRLKEMEMGERLSSLDTLARGAGPQTLEQLSILMLESAMLVPPANELPSAAAPDAATQVAMMGRVVDYTTKQFAALPRMIADKTTARYQNGADHIHTSTGYGSHTADADLGFKPEDIFLHALGRHTTRVESLAGVELAPAKVKGQDPAGQNGQISQSGAGPNLAMILVDAAKGKMGFSRWETIDGKRVAVYSFAVPRKQSHYVVNYCCFPTTENTGGMGSYSIATSFEPFHAAPGYHGELFIDPESGVIVRLVTEAEMKPADFVQQEDTRIDYGTTAIEGKQYTVAMHSMLLTTVVPAGESFQKFSKRRTLFDMQYANYQLSAVAAARP